MVSAVELHSVVSAVELHSVVSAVELHSVVEDVNSIPWLVYTDHASWEAVLRQWVPGPRLTLPSLDPG